MSRSDNLYELPGNLPVPEDDGACAHLLGMKVPSVPLPSTAGGLVDLAALRNRTVVYCYPRTGRPDRDPVAGWDQIPGARGCTPQSCGFRDAYDELLASSVAAVFGVSTQDTEYQREAVERLRLPFPLLSDAQLEFAKALRIPTFEVEGVTLLKRVTLVLANGVVEQVFYPIFPPDSNAAAVIHWLVERMTGGMR